MLNIWSSLPLSLYFLISFYLIQTFPIYKTIMVPYMYYEFIYVLSGLPQWLNDKESACQCRRHGFNPWTAKILWRREWQHTSVFLPGKSHGQRRLVGYTVHGITKKSDMTQQLNGIEVLTSIFYWQYITFTFRSWPQSKL